MFGRLSAVRITGLRFFSTIVEKTPTFSKKKPIAEVFKEVCPDDFKKHEEVLKFRQKDLADVLKEVQGMHASEAMMASDIKILSSFRIFTPKDWTRISAPTKKKLEEKGLPESIIAALDEKIGKTPLEIIQDASVYNAENWQYLPDSDKDIFKAKGVSSSIITGLNQAVRVGLLLPSFKFLDKVKFLDCEEHIHSHQEALTLWDHAFAVDELWHLDRASCQTLCENYQEMLEITMKYYIKRYSNNIFKGGRPYPKGHHLEILQEEMQHACDKAPRLCSPDALRTITKCGEDSKYEGAQISCADFYEITQKHTDAFFLEMVERIRDEPATRIDYLKFKTKQYSFLTDGPMKK